MAPKPRNYDWLNVSTGFQSDFEWQNGAKVLNLLNFTMLVGFSAFAAQILFGIPTLVGVVDESASLSDYDLALIYLAIMSLMAIWVVRLKIMSVAAALILAMAGLICLKFWELLMVQGTLGSDSFSQLIMLPIIVTLGILIVVTYLWASVQVWRARSTLL